MTTNYLETGIVIKKEDGVEENAAVDAFGDNSSDPDPLLASRRMSSSSDSPEVSIVAAFRVSSLRS